MSAQVTADHILSGRRPVARNGDCSASFASHDRVYRFPLADGEPRIRIMRLALLTAWTPLPAPGACLPTSLVRQALDGKPCAALSRATAIGMPQPYLAFTPETPQLC